MTDQHEDETTTPDTPPTTPRAVQRCGIAAITIAGVAAIAGITLAAAAGDTARHPLILVTYTLALAAAVTLGMVWLVDHAIRPVITGQHTQAREISGLRAEIIRLRAFVWHHGYGAAVDELVPDESIPPPTPLHRDRFAGLNSSVIGRARVPARATQ